MFTLWLCHDYDEETQSDNNYFYFEGNYERGDFGYPIRPVYVG